MEVPAMPDGIASSCFALLAMTVNPHNVMARPEAEAIP